MRVLDDYVCPGLNDTLFYTRKKKRSSSQTTTLNLFQHDCADSLTLPHKDPSGRQYQKQRPSAFMYFCNALDEVDLFIFNISNAVDPSSSFISQSVPHLPLTCDTEWTCHPAPYDEISTSGNCKMAQRGFPSRASSPTVYTGTSPLQYGGCLSLLEAAGGL